MPSEREWRRIDAARASAELAHRAASWLRDDPRRPATAGLQHDHVAHALADLVDALADVVAGLDSAVRWQLEQSARVVLGETMESPTIRRTRRR